MLEYLGLVAAVAMPFWNIPLMIGIAKRKSSKDISLAWALGVYACILAMLPSGLASPDHIFRVFTVVNTLLFGGVVAFVLRYR